MIYKYEITETLNRHVTVRANSEEDARKLIEYKYYDEGSITLDSDDFYGDCDINLICTRDDDEYTNEIDYDLAHKLYILRFQLSSIVFSSLEDMEEFDENECLEKILLKFKREKSKRFDEYTLVWKSENSDEYYSLLESCKQILKILEEHNASYVFSFGKYGQTKTISCVAD